MEDVVKSFLFVFATFLPIIDPFGGAMFFLSLTPGASDEIRAKITERMAIYSLIVLLVSLFAGRVILSFFWNLCPGSAGRRRPCASVLRMGGAACADPCRS